MLDTRDNTTPATIHKGTSPLAKYRSVLERAQCGIKGG